MDNRTVLCLDSEACSHPEMLGLGDERFEAQPWLKVYCDAEQARAELRRDIGCEPVWVVSSDTMEGINLAAALKRDCGDRDVDLVSFGGSGSVVGRCEAAGVGLIHTQAEFARRYTECKRRHLEGRRASFQTTQETREEAARRSIAALHVEEPAFERSFQAGDARQGATEVFERSGAAASVRSGVREQAASIGKAAVGQGAFVMAVVSGSGGVGKSSLAACCAVHTQMQGLRTLVVDADMQFGDMGYLVGAKDPVDLAELSLDPDRAARIEADPEVPALACVPKRLEESEAIVDRMARLIAGVRPHFDVVVINTGSFWSELHAQIIESSDLALFVLDQRPSSIRSCTRALDLCRRCGIATQPFRFVLNFCSRHALLTSIDVSCALQGATVEEVKDGGKEVGELLGAGLSRELLVSKNPFSESVQALCERLVPALAGGQSAGRSGRKEARRGLFSGKKGRAACL